MTNITVEKKFYLKSLKVGSILRPLVFNIFIFDEFYFLEDFEIANYSHDSTPNSAKRNHKVAIEELVKSSSDFFIWLQTTK